MRARPTTILNTATLKITILLLAFGAVLLGCGSDEETDSAATETTSADGGQEVAATTASEPVPADTPTDADADADADPDADTGGDAEELFPDVVGAAARQDGDGTWTVEATLSSPYDSPERYADAWRVIGPDGTVYGTRILTHDHASEQPFTRSQNGIAIPDDVDTVTVEGRDQVSGWGGETFQLELTR